MTYWMHGHAPAVCTAAISKRCYASGSRIRRKVAASKVARRSAPRSAIRCAAQTGTAQTSACEDPAAMAAAVADWQQRSPEVVAAVDGNPTGMQITFLGTGASVLTPGRAGTSVALRVGAETLLFGVPEDTQRRLLVAPQVKPSRISRIFVAATVPDQLGGLPGMLCNISAARELGHEGADVPLHLYGPLGLGRFLAAAMQLSDTYLLCPVLIHELVPGPVPGRDADHEGDNWTPYYRQIHRRARLHAAQLPPDQLNPRGHYDARLRPVFSRFTRPRKGRDERSGYLPLSLPPPGDPRLAGSLGVDATTWTLDCGEFMVVATPQPGARQTTFAWTVVEADRAGALDVDAAKAAGVLPGRAFGELKAGRAVQSVGGEMVQPEQVTGPDRPGRRLMLISDPFPVLPPLAARNASVVIGPVAQVPPDSSMSRGQLHGTSADMDGELLTPAAAVASVAERLGAATIILTHLEAAQRPSKGVVQPADQDGFVVEAAADLAVYNLARL